MHASHVVDPARAAATRPTSVKKQLLLAGLLAATLAQAQPISTAGDAWRATSRLGFGPTPDTAQAAQAAPRSWAEKQIDAALAASRQPANIPAHLTAFNAPLGDIVRGYEAERSQLDMARRKLAERAPGMDAGAASDAMVQASAPAPTASPAAPAAPFPYSRALTDAAAEWRILSCSDAAVEQPLLARMTEFWFNHFNVFRGKPAVRPFVGHYVVNAIRPHALGRFEDLLLATAHHPAMLFYLDQTQSRARGLNENYARELLELHTLGVEGGYTQTDVRELARILTGWTVPLQRGEGFAFADRLHDQGEKTLLGNTIRANGLQEGEDALRMLARHPATARRIALRLAETFVSDQPPQALVDQLSATFLRTQGDIGAVMKSLVASPDFWQAGNTLFKTPLDFACSALTATGGVKSPGAMQLSLGFLAQGGQPVHGWQTPDGYKTRAGTWMAPEALTHRADYALGLAARMEEPTFLAPFINARSRERIAQEAPSTRAGLLLASPDFMRK